MQRISRPEWFGIIKNIVLILVGGLFLLLGIDTLVAAYRLEDPFSFVMTFFASNLIILISAVLIAGFGIRLFNFRNYATKDEQTEPEP